MSGETYIKIGSGVSFGVVAGLIITKLLIATEDMAHDLKDKLGDVPIYALGGLFGAAIGGVVVQWAPKP
tara:strand:+ start:343 stop:549 length:207 start_codon:yes stop_codon:yes gene_type:complete